MSLLNLFRVSEIKAPSSRFIKHCAFTLAEVLIVIGIIGIIADMTIPTLVSSYQEKVTVTRLKKAYSILSQAYTFAVAENGPAEYWDIDRMDSMDGALKLYYIFKPYLKIIEDCNSKKGCFYTGEYKTLQGTTFGAPPATWTVYARGRLSDGTSIAFWSAGSGCNWNWSKSGMGSLSRGCGCILVDINGDKKPNQAGKDYFRFQITKDNIIPDGTADFNMSIGDNGCSIKNTNRANGIACTAWVLYKENMDYLRRDVSWDE